RALAGRRSPCAAGGGCGEQRSYRRRGHWFRKCHHHGPPIGQFVPSLPMPRRPQGTKISREASQKVCLGDPSRSPHTAAGRPRIGRRRTSSDVLHRLVSVARNHIMGVCAGHNRTRWASGLLFGLLLVFVVGAVLVPAAGVARAQEAEEKKKDGEETAKKKLGDTNLFTHIIESAGWFFGPLLFLVSIGLVTLIVLLAMDLRMGVARRAGVADDFT